jgi:hypothetical protein
MINNPSLGFRLWPHPESKDNTFTNYNDFRLLFRGYTNDFIGVLENFSGLDSLSSVYVIEKFLYPKIWEKFYLPFLED